VFGSEEFGLNLEQALLMRFGPTGRLQVSGVGGSWSCHGGGKLAAVSTLTELRSDRSPVLKVKDENCSELTGAHDDDLIRWNPPTSASWVVGGNPLGRSSLVRSWSGGLGAE